MFARSAAALLVLSFGTIAGAQQTIESPTDALGATGVGERVTVKMTYEGDPARRVVSNVPTVVAIAAESPLRLTNEPEYRTTQPRYGFLRLAREKKIAFALDRSEPGTQVYDLLYLDRNVNRDLTDDGDPIKAATVLAESRDLTYSEFPPIELDLYYGKDMRERFSVLLYAWYPRNGLLTRLLMSSLSWREGEVHVHGAKMRLAVFDGNNDGVYDVESSRWSMQPIDLPRDGLFDPENRIAANVPIRIDGVPFKVATITPDGRLLDLESETSDNASKAELKFNPLLLEPPRPQSDAEVLWTSSLDLAIEVARADKKHVFVYFGADWARSSRLFDERTLHDAEVRSLLGEFICYRTNPDLEPSAAKRYGVSAIPTVLLLDGDGDVVERVVGYRQARSFANLLRTYR